MKILIAGGTGFIGSHLSRHFIEGKHEVICVDNLLTSGEHNIKDLVTNPRFQFIKHDVTKPLPSALSADAVYHLASPASPNHHSRLSYHALPMETMLVNTMGTIELLKFAKAHNAKFLFASTSEAYGDPLEHPQKEEYRGNVSTTGPRSVYDEAKRFGETITSYFVRSEQVDGRIARIFNTYGPGLSREDMRMIVRFITQALSGEPLTVFGDGQQTRSLCYISDLVDGLDKLMFSKNTKGEIINLGSEDEHTVLDYAHLVIRLTKSTSKVEMSEQLPVDDPVKRRPDITKARKLLGWQPQVSLEEGLSRMIEYVKSL